MKIEFLKEAIKESAKNGENDWKSGGPFGAVIVKDGKIIAQNHNRVLEKNDPSAHAEVNTVRDACKKLNTHDLSGCELYVNAAPCPMCLSVAIWANIKTIYYANTAEETDKIGFRDDMIYDFIKGKDSDELGMRVTHVPDDDAKQVFEDFIDNTEKIMY